MKPVLITFSFWLSLSAHGAADDLTERTSSPKTVRLPGMVIDLTNRCVELEATVCVNDGLLELVACTKGSKEHESIFAVSARAMHLHTGLLAIGANSGHPVSRNQVPNEDGHWVQVPATGDRIDVALVTRNASGELIERPISDCVVASTQRVDEVDGRVIVAPESAASSDSRSPNVFPHQFVFAGSRFRRSERLVHHYSADLSGNLISIATFGDEVLSLPFSQSQNNAQLSWRANPETLPKRGTKVILRLRPAPGANRFSSQTDPPQAQR